MPERERRGFLSRLLGWSWPDACAVESAFRAVILAAEHAAALVLCGSEDLVLIARAHGQVRSLPGSLCSIVLHRDPMPVVDALH